VRVRAHTRTLAHACSYVQGHGTFQKYTQQINSTYKTHANLSLSISLLSHELAKAYVRLKLQ